MKPKDPNPKSNLFARESLELKVTALLLGELGPDDRDEVERAMARDPELRAFHQRMQRTIGRVTEAVPAAAPSPAMATTATTAKASTTAEEEPVLQLSEDRRRRLMDQFKSPVKAVIANKPRVPRRRFVFVNPFRMPWFVPAAVAACAIVFAGLMLPAFTKSKHKAQEKANSGSEWKFVLNESVSGWSELAPATQYDPAWSAEINGAVDKPIVAFMEDRKSLRDGYGVNELGEEARGTQGLPSTSGSGLTRDYAYKRPEVAVRQQVGNYRMEFKGDNKLPAREVDGAKTEAQSSGYPIFLPPTSSESPAPVTPPVPSSGTVSVRKEDLDFGVTAGRSPSRFARVIDAEKNIAESTLNRLSASTALPTDKFASGKDGLSDGYEGRLSAENPPVLTPFGNVTNGRERNAETRGLAILSDSAQSPELSGPADKSELGFQVQAPRGGTTASTTRAPGRGQSVDQFYFAEVAPKVEEPISRSTRQGGPIGGSIGGGGGAGGMGGALNAETGVAVNFESEQIAQSSGTLAKGLALADLDSAQGLFDSRAQAEAKKPLSQLQSGVNQSATSGKKNEALFFGGKVGQVDGSRAISTADDSGVAAGVDRNWEKRLSGSEQNLWMVPQPNAKAKASSSQSYAVVTLGDEPMAEGLPHAAGFATESLAAMEIPPADPKERELGRRMARPTVPQKPSPELPALRNEVQRQLAVPLGTTLAVPAAPVNNVGMDDLESDLEFIVPSQRAVRTETLARTLNESVRREVQENQLAVNVSGLEEVQVHLFGVPDSRGITVALDDALAVAGKPAEKKLAELELLDEALESKAEVLSKFSTVSAEPKLAAAKPAPTAAAPLPETLTALNPFSTFSLNVSDVSFKLASSSLANGAMPEPGTVRSEEFVNAMDYHDPAPAPGASLAMAWEQARNAFEHNRDLLRFSIQTAAIGREAGRPLNLVILLDNSGSMERADRVQIVREALSVLARQLTPADKISVVAFARSARLWVDGLKGGEPDVLMERVGGLNPEGGTNLELALSEGYQTAEKHFLTGGNNRVILLTDGAANLGNVEAATLRATVESHRRKGIALDCFGVGWEGYNDELLESLSRNGDGRYGFINDPVAAATHFASQLAGALRVAASDVKSQVEFNPARVTSYRQIGYEKHQLTKEQFRDNTVDAAEIGAAESGTALYSIQVKPNGSGPIGVVRVRYKSPSTGQYFEKEWLLPYNPSVRPLDQAYPSMRLAAVSAAFAEWLAGSPYAGNVSLAALQHFLNGVPETYPLDPRPAQLRAMIGQARSITGQ